MRFAALCTILVLVLVAAAQADYPVLINKYNDVTNGRVIYSYMLVVSDPASVVPGVSEFAIEVPLQVISVGDANYWHSLEITPQGPGSKVVWRMTALPPRPRGFYSTFDIVVRNGVEGVEDGPINWCMGKSGGTVCGQVYGPVPKEQAPPPDPGSLEGYVFLDANTNGRYDAGEVPVPGIELALYDQQSSLVATTVCNEDGHYRFDGLAAGGEFVVRPSDGGPSDVKIKYVVWTTPVPSASQLIKTKQTNRVDFGLTLNLDRIKTDLLNGTITGTNLSRGYWKKQIGSTLGVLGGRPEEDVYYALGQAEGLWLETPFQFSPMDDGPDGPVNVQGLWEAYSILTKGVPGARGRAMVQLLAAEMNWPSGRRSSLPQLEGLVYWYAEWLVANPQVTDAQLGQIKNVLEVYNVLGD